MDIIKTIFEANSDDIYIHDSCKEEIVELISGTGQEDSFFRDLSLAIKQLSQFKHQAPRNLANKFHKLTGPKYKNLYRIALRGGGNTYNIRIVYSIQKDKFFLLLCFWKKKTKQSYDVYLKPTQQRLAEMLREFGG